MPELVVIALGCFIAAYINAAFATGGVYIMLACMTSILPLTTAIPLLPAFALPSLFTRVILFWQHIDWKIVKSFLFGSVIGVFLGAQVFVSLSESTISLLVGCLILALTWGPRLKLPMPKRNVFLFAGASHSFIGTLFGIGGIIQPLIIRTSLLKVQVTGTLAACLFFMGLLKISSYMVNGFSYQSYGLYILAATAAGVIGAWAGKHSPIDISEHMFRRIFKFITTVVGLSLFYQFFVL